jgi:site-specific DNA-cytosine methylase
MKILVACEFSGIVREAFSKLGHNAWSCDFLPSEIIGQHYKGNMFDILDDGWDLVIVHPPCTAIALSGNRWYAGTQKRQEAIEFIELIWDFPNIKHLAIENPVGVLSTQSKLSKATQYIQPWQFGHGETKKTGLWLRDLPPLIPSDIVDGRKNRIWKMPGGVNQAKNRSRIYPGIAKAMAEQWSKYLEAL